MSRRGGGRRADSQRDRDSPAPPPSFQRGGGRGGGRGPRGGRGSASAFTPSPAPAPARAPAPAPARVPAPAPAPAPERAPEPAPAPAPARAPAPAPAPAPARALAPAFPPLAASAAQHSAASPSTSAPPAPVPAPSSSTSGAQLRREVEKKLTLGDPSTSSKALVPPLRPGFGRMGRRCTVMANHFLVEVGERDLHQYDVTITPQVTSKKVNRDVIAQLVKLYSVSHLGKRMPAYDGMKSIYTAGPLPFESKEFVVKLGDKDGSSTKPRKDREFKVVIRFASKADLHHLLQFLAGRQRDAPQETIQVLDVVLRTLPSQNYVTVGRSFFDPKLGQQGELGNGVEFWKGYYQSLRPTQMGLSLNVDVSARAFYEPVLVTEFVAKYFNRDLSRRLSDQDRVKLKKALRGIKVVLTHMGFTKSHRITGISTQPVNQITFTLDDKKTKISVPEYFHNKYGIALHYVFMPALQAGSDANPVYLPMELCRIAEGQRYSKRLNERQVRNLLRATCQRPRDRENSIKEVVWKSSYSRDELVRKEFGIQVKEELTPVEARVLPAPKLKYHESGQEAWVDPSVGQWNMINKKMVNGGRVDYWTCANFSSWINRELPSEFCRQLIDMCNSKGIVFNRNPILPIRTFNASQIENSLFDLHEESKRKLANEKVKQLQLLIVILPDITGSYGKIKRVCETELGIVSQCCQPRQAAKLDRQYFENVALKINVKVGGRNTVLNDAVQRNIRFVSDHPTIIFGADVTHPQPGEDSSPSIAAVVASMDWPEVTKYRGLVSAQAHREEIIQDLYKLNQDPNRGLVHGGMIKELFIAFRRATGFKPHRIIFYRDGVSEGQFSQVLLYEIDAIRKACASLEPDYMPPITFVVVQKRHHTRLFPREHGRRDQTDRSGNILPGTVVDTMICHPTEFDFYLNSHAGIQGTSRPTHYHVLFDENRFDADSLQSLTNNLCYTYARCTRSVSIVPPAYYAHLAAFRARYYMEGDASDGGSSSGRSATTEVRALPLIKDNVKDVMFYC